jgi:putative ABC transport system substrate-binding protein
MRRREFIVLVGAAATWPLTADAQQPVRRIGVLTGFTESDPEGQILLAAFRDGLRAAGWIEGRNVRLEVRWAAAADPVLMRTYASELVNLKPDVILVHGTRAFTAVRRESGIIPIVFAAINDPVGQTIVESLARPGGSVTGFTPFEGSSVPKLLEALKEIAPAVVRVALIFNPDTSTWIGHWRSLQNAAPLFGVKLITAPSHNPTEIQSAIEALASEPNSGLIVVPDLTLITHRELLIAVTTKLRLPAVYTDRLYVMAGGLMSYGIDLSENYRGAASYVDRIFKGELPGDLPVQQPTKFHFAINLKAAKALGLEVPPSILLRADEVIE